MQSTKHPKADLLIALAEGKTLQWRNPKVDDFFFDAENHQLHCFFDNAYQHLEWRVKPEKKPDVKLYSNIYKGRIGGLHQSLQAATDGAMSGRTGVLCVTQDAETGEPIAVEIVKTK